MRLSILAFAAGVLFLQWQAALPVMAVLGGLGGLALFGQFLSARRVHWASCVLSLLCCALLGFVSRSDILHAVVTDPPLSIWR